jgi:hypothetical protein
MHHPAVAGDDLHRRDPAVLGERRGDREAPVDVAFAGGHGVVGPRVERQVGGAERPRGRELARWRQVARVALGRSVRHPALDQRDLRGGQAARVEEVAEARHRLPGRHVVGGGGAANLPPLRVGVGVGREREGRDLAWAVTRLTVRLEHADDLVVERHRLGPGRRPGGQQGSNQPQAGDGRREPGPVTPTRHAVLSSGPRILPASTPRGHPAFTPTAGEKGPDGPLSPAA